MIFGSLRNGIEQNWNQERVLTSYRAVRFVLAVFI
jgi:hypothetical protein